MSEMAKDKQKTVETPMKVILSHQDIKSITGGKSKTFAFVTHKDDLFIIQQKSSTLYFAAELPVKKKQSITEYYNRQQFYNRR